MTLRISPSLTLPLDVATRATAILGVRGSGKTYAAAVLVEQLAGANVPTVVVDPVGVWWGLRSAADAKKTGLPFVIFGGSHADVPLEEGAGELVADVVIAERLSAVLDLSDLRKAAGKRFMEAFLERLYQQAAIARTSMHLCVDEADVVAPQRPLPGEQRLLGATEDIVRRGRARGIGVTLITQRPQSLAKDVLTQCEILLAMRLSHPLDIKAVDAWIETHGLEAERARVIASLPSLPTGEGWAWAPVLGLLERVKVGKRWTFDSSATPKPGESRVEPKARAEVDLDAIRAKVAATIERAKEEDPKALRRRIAELELALADAAAVEPPAPETVEVPAITPEIRTDLRDAVETLSRLVDRIAEALEKGPASRPTAGPQPGPAVVRVPAASAPRIVVMRSASAAALGGGAARMVAALEGFPGSLSRTELAIHSLLAHNAGGFRGCLSELRTSGRIADEGGRVALLGDRTTRTPKGAATLASEWAPKLSGSANRMLAQLIAVYPKGMTREALGQAVGLEANAGGFRGCLSELNVPALIEKRGREVCASPALFLGGRR